MNFLSHYFLEDTHASPYRKLGALLPDFIYQFNRKLRKNIFSHGMPESLEHRQLFEGIQSHYETDALFHGSDFFSRYSKLILARMKELPLPSVRFRTYFIAHVFLELMLDRLLVKQYPSASVKIYNDLESVNTEEAASYFSLTGNKVVYSEFFDNFNRFLNARHLLFLADNEIFANALLRAYQKVNPAYPSREETEILMALADEIETEHRHELLGIFESLRQTTGSS